MSRSVVFCVPVERVANYGEVSCNLCEGDVCRNCLRCVCNLRVALVGENCGRRLCNLLGGR